MTALTVFCTNTNDTLVSTARQLTNAAPASETTAVTTNISKQCVDIGKPWQEIFAQSGSGGTGSSEPAPSGLGFIWDVTTLEGQQIAAGTWTPTVKLSMNVAGFNADITCRAWNRHSNGTFTQLGNDMILSGQVLSTSPTVYTFGATNIPAANFATGDKLYIDFILNFTANPGTFGTATLTFYENGGANEQVVTPGYAAQSSITPGSGDAFYDYLGPSPSYRPRGNRWHPYHLGNITGPPEIFQVGTGLPGTNIAFNGQVVDRPRPPARPTLYHSLTDRILPDEQTVSVLAPAIIIPEFPMPAFWRMGGRNKAEPGQALPALPPLPDASSLIEFASQMPDRQFVTARRYLPEHAQQPLIIGGPDPVQFSPVVWDVPAQPRPRDPRRISAPAEAMPFPAALVSDAVIRLDWLGSGSPLPVRQARVVDPAAVTTPMPKPDAQETLTAGALFPQPATLVRQPLDRRDAVRAWDQVPIIDGGPLAWIYQSPATGVKQARTRPWDDSAAPAVLAAPITLPFPWTQIDTPTVQWRTPRAVPAWGGSSYVADVNPLANGLILIRVNGPYFVVAAQLYCPGVVAGIVSTE